RPEDREDAVAGGLGDVAAVALYRLPHQFECRVDYGAGLLRVDVLDQLHRALDVGKERGHRLALALKIFGDGRFCRANLNMVGFLSRNSYRWRSERCAALTTEFSRRGVLEAARSARRYEWGATFVAKLQPLRVFGFAFRAEHLPIPFLRTQLIEQ